MYHDRTVRDSAQFEDVLDTVDLDFQHHLHLSDVTTSSAGIPALQERLRRRLEITADPEQRTDDLISAFLQDEITLADRLKLTIGSKFRAQRLQRVSNTSPARLAWKVDAQNTVWAAASRAVRTPSIIDADIVLSVVVAPGVTPTVASVEGNPDFKSETLIAYEAGWRVRPADFVSADVAVFTNRYDRLRSIGMGTPFLENQPPPPHNVIPFQLQNGFDAKSWGIEASSVVEPAAGVRLHASYAYLRVNFSEDSAEGRDPQHTAWVRAAVDLGPGWTLDGMGRYVSRLKAFDIDGYIEADLRVAYRPAGENLELAIVGQNLVHESHAEFGSEATRSEMERGAYLSVAWGF